MAGDVRVVLNRKGVRDLLVSREVQADLKRRADRIAAAAGPGNDADVTVGRNRARAGIITSTPEAMAREAHRKSLTSALDAGR